MVYMYVDSFWLNDWSICFDYEVRDRDLIDDHDDDDNDNDNDDNNDNNDDIYVSYLSNIIYSHLLLYQLSGL